MVIFELLETLKLLLQVANLAEVAGGLGGLDLALVLLDVLVDAFHSDTGLRRPELVIANHTGAPRHFAFSCPAPDLP